MTVVKSHVLRFQYVFADDAKVEKAYLRDRTILQLYTLPLDQRPPEPAQTFNQRDHPDTAAVNGFLPLEEWTYFDDEMLKFLEARDPELFVQLKR